MTDYILFTDTDCDVTPEYAKKVGIEGLISMPYSIDGVETHPYVDFDTFNAHEFYDKLRGGVLPKTGAIPISDYTDAFEPYFAQGKDILYVHFSAAMSMTFENMRQAEKILCEKYPERKLYTVDAKGISIIGLAIATEVAKLYKEGKSAQEIVDWSKTEVDHWAVYFFADDLKFFKASGRVSGLTATMGSILGIRPLINMNAEGKMESYGTAKGRRKAIEAIVSKVEELGDHVSEHPIYIANCDCMPLVEEVIKAIKAKFGENLDIQVYDVNPTAGSHCGPNALGVCFHSTQR